MRIAIVGAGGHGQLIADAIWASSDTASVEIFFLDDNPTLLGTKRLGIPILGNLAALSQIDHDALVLGFGDNRGRQQFIEAHDTRGETFINVIHPRASLGRQVTLGKGVFVSANAVISTGSSVGNFSVINTGCTVGHHNRIGDFVHVGPGVHTGGDVEIGDGVFLGIGSNIMPQRTIGAWSTIGAGSLAHRNVLAGVTVVGVPAREIVKPQAHAALQVEMAI